MTWLFLVNRAQRRSVYPSRSLEIQKQGSNPAQSPIRIVEQTTGREVGWVNRFLDREYVRRLADKTLCTGASVIGCC